MGSPASAVTWQLLGFAVKGPLVGTGWANSYPGCMNGVRKHYLHHVGGSFLAGKVVWVLYLCFLARNADYCVFVN